MQFKTIKYLSFFLLILAVSTLSLQAKSIRFRAMWRSNPATSMVVGWDQVSGNNPVFYFGEEDRGKNYQAYPAQQKPDKVMMAKGMNNHFVRLENLRPNTIYYFVVVDNEGVSRRLSFKTTPDNPLQRLSIVGGGDSRNNRDARLNANRLVSKLRPDFILFSGDFTADDNAPQWQRWFDDWQMTLGSDGRLFPIVVARGNHEATNKTMTDLFDVKFGDAYYALSFGGNLLRVYTLNTMIPSGGQQKIWLETDLKSHRNKIWKIAQYHQAIKPHTDSKPELNELLINWATLFHKYHMDIALESDAHVVKWTWPIRPSREPGSEEGFIRDDEHGTVYLGEGGWGAPLRNNNDDKAWTRNSGSFNQFKWIFVDQYHIEVRTIGTKGADKVAEVMDYNRFVVPQGLNVWSPSNGDVLTVVNRNAPPPPPEPEEITGIEDPQENPDGLGMDADNVETIIDEAPPESQVKKENDHGTINWLNIDPVKKTVKVRYNLTAKSKVDIIIIDNKLQEVTRATLQNQDPGPYIKTLDFSKIQDGGYLIIIKANGKVRRRYRVKKG